MPTFIQEGFKKTRKRRSGSKRPKTRHYRARRRQTTTSRAMTDAMKFPLAMASIGAGIGAFSATASAFKK